MPQSETKYSLLVYSLRLPYRVFLDPGVYYVNARGTRWRVSLKDVPRNRIEYTHPPMEFPPRSQLAFDSHGYAGVTEALVGYPLDPPLTHDEVFALQQSSDRVTLRDALAPLNHVISLYRAKTREFWFRPLGAKDIPALTVWILPEGSTELEWMMTSTNTQIAVGTPFLKTEDWYADLLRRAETGSPVPFFLDLFAEGQDALARDNLRLAATNFALAAEALFRALLLEHFPDEDPTRPAEQLLSRYFKRYREISDAGQPAVQKRDALKLLRTIWAPRDHLLHGHDVALTLAEVTDSEHAFLELVQLWDQRPNADPMLIQGPFVAFESGTFPPADTAAMLERAINRYGGGHLDDAYEAAMYATLITPENLDAHMLAGVYALRKKDYPSAVRHFEFIVTRDPNFSEAVQNLEQARKLAASADEGSAT